MPSAGPIGNPEGWLFRIAHNTALDFLRRRSRQQAIQSGEEVDMIADPADSVASRQIAGASLRTFMRLPVAQRSSVILMDVLGCSLSEVCEVMDFSQPSIRMTLARWAAEDDEGLSPRPAIWRLSDWYRSGRRSCPRPSPEWVDSAAPAAKKIQRRIVCDPEQPAFRIADRARRLNGGDGLHQRLLQHILAVDQSRPSARNSDAISAASRPERRRCWVRPEHIRESTLIRLFSRL